MIYQLTSLRTLDNPRNNFLVEPVTLDEPDLEIPSIKTTTTALLTTSELQTMEVHDPLNSFDSSKSNGQVLLNPLTQLFDMSLSMSYFPILHRYIKRVVFVIEATIDQYPY